MGGHMGHVQRTVLNLLVVAVDERRNLLFVEGSVPGATDGEVTITRGRKAARANFEPPVLGGVVAEPEIDEVPVAEASAEAETEATEASEAAQESTTTEGSAE